MIQNKKIVLIQGYTGSGKTTCSNYLQRKYNFSELHPFGFYKRWLEGHYDCPNLDTQKGKNFVPTGMDITMQKLMVDCFHFWEPIDPYFTTRNLGDSLDELLTDTKVSGIALVGFRNTAEVDALFNCLWGYNLEPTFIKITRPNKKPETSDIHNEKIWSMFEDYYRSRCFSLINDGSISDLEAKLDVFV